MSADSSTVVQPAPVPAPAPNFQQIIQSAFSGLGIQASPANLTTVYNCIQVMVAQHKFDPTEFTTLLSTLFLIYEAIPTLTYAQKKASIMSLINTILGSIPMSDEDRAIMNAAMALGSPVLDQLYDFLYAQADQLLGKTETAVENSACWKSCCSAETPEPTPTVAKARVVRRK